MLDRLALIRSRHAEAGGGDADKEWLMAEVERLRNTLGLCRVQLSKAALYRGYSGGPLGEPATSLALGLANAAEARP
jgi:hypothetical protein